MFIGYQNGNASVLAETKEELENMPCLVFDEIKEVEFAQMVNGKIVFEKNAILDELKTAKLAELKNTRDTLEVEPITYNGNNFDYDEKARDRINAAIIALDMQTQLTGTEASLSWTTADNKEAIVTANDLRGVIAMVALRSNELHIAYRKAKDKVNNATTKEELESIVLE